MATRNRMDLRQLECFVAVAEELNFRRASERLSLSQSALSERIAALEQALGVQLLFRTTRQVSLTRAGAEFLRDTSAVLAEIDRSVANARHCAESGLGRVRVGGVDEAISMLLPAVLRVFRRSHPGVQVQLLEISSSDRHTRELASQRTDVAFVRAPVNDDFIGSELLYRQPVMMVLAADHPLAAADCLRTQDLLDQPVVGYPRHARPILHELLWRGFRQLGREPNIVCEVIDKSSLLQFVANGLGIGLVPAWVQATAPPGLAFVPFLPEERAIDLYLASRRRGNAPVVEDFIATARLVAADVAVWRSESP